MNIELQYYQAFLKYKLRSHWVDQEEWQHSSNMYL